MKEKKEFQKPEAEVIEIEKSDIITDSTGDIGGEDMQNGGPIIWG